MKIKFLATNKSPHSYSFEGEIITAHFFNSESFDLSSLRYGDRFKGLEVEKANLIGGYIIREAERDKNGELYVTLCQTAPNGNWKESNWIDAEDYDPNELYIKGLK